MTQRSVEPDVTKRVVHPDGSVSHVHVRGGAVLLASLHPGDPAPPSREEVLAAWDEVAAEAGAERLVP